MYFVSVAVCCQGRTALANCMEFKQYINQNSVCKNVYAGGYFDDITFLISDIIVIVLMMSNFFEA